VLREREIARELFERERERERERRLLESFLRETRELLA